MDTRKTLKELLVLFSPLWLFAVLMIPYGWFNQSYVVEWFGCGCPVMDAQGNFSDRFNANDFNLYFWFGIALIITLIGVFLSKRIPKSKWWLRVLYVLALFGVAFRLVFVMYYRFQWM